MHVTRLDKTWKRLRGEKRKALIPFITAGDPHLTATEKLVLTLERGGADIIELGIPFSDPMADGPVIQRASERALAQGATLKKILNLVATVRKQGAQSLPILLMGYYNPIFVYGLRRYAREAARAGVDATLVVDLPPEESQDLDRELKRVGIHLIYLLTPTSDSSRISRVAEIARGFIYFVSMTGITGGALRSEAEIRGKIREIRRKTSLPIAVGFGIRKPVQARRIAQFADGVVVGSALVKLIDQGKSQILKKILKNVEGFIRRLKSSL